MEATSWLDATVQRTKEKYQIQRAQEEQLAHELSLKRRLGNQFCRKLFSWFEHVEVSFNTRFGSQVLVVSVLGTQGNRSVQILGRPLRAQERIAEVRYHEESATLKLSVGSGGTAAAQMIKFVLRDDEIVAEVAGKHYTPQQLGQKIIDDLLA